MKDSLQTSNISTVLFDLDATLYPAGCGLWPAIGRRIEAYLLQVMKIPENEIPWLKQLYYQNYGTTLKGLQINHNIDARVYLDFVHDLPIETYLSPDPDLKRMLERMAVPGWVFTNSDRGHSRRVLRALGIEGCFSGIIAIEDLKFECKPNPSAYHQALEIAGISDPTLVAFLDDSPRNLQAAHELGFFTILVGKGDNGPSAHPALDRPHDLPQILPHIFQN